jgi:ferrous iron transport protein B
LEYFPQDKERNAYYERLIAQTGQQSLDNDLHEKEMERLIVEIKKEQNEVQKENSCIGKIGHFIEPVVKPLGFDWKIGASLVSGMAAKEIVVSTLGILYTGEEDNDKALQERLIASRKPDGSPVYTPLVAFTFLLFVLIYFPCIATIVAIKNESGAWKWALFEILYTTSLAWIVSFLFYQIVRLIV